MGLEGKQQAAAGEGTTHCGERGGHLDRMMAVVVDQGERAAARELDVATALEAATDAAELGKCLGDCGVLRTRLATHGNGGERVQDIVQAGQVKRHLQVCRRRAAPALFVGNHAKVHLPATVFDVNGADVVVHANAISQHGLTDAVADILNVRIIAAQHGQPVKGKVLDEIHECLLEAIEVMAIGFHVVGIDIGHHRQDRLQIKERRVRFVCFRHQEFAATEPRVGAGRRELAADDEGRIHARFGQHAGDEAGGRSLAVGAGDGDALLQPHQFRQHHGARDDRHCALARRHHLRVVTGHGGGDDNGVGRADVPRGVAQQHGRSQRFQALRDGVVGEVRSTHLVAEVQQYLRNAAHAGAADPDKVNMFDFMPHGCPGSVRSQA